MDIFEVLKKHSASKNESLYNQTNSLAAGNSFAVGKLIEVLPLQTLFLLRSLHSELTLTQVSIEGNEVYLIDHIDNTIAFTAYEPYASLKYDRNTETGLTHQKKMKGLLE